MRIEELTSVAVAGYAFEDLAVRSAAEVEHYALSRAWGRTVEAAGFVVPDFMSPSQMPESAHFRVVGTGAAAVRAVLRTWTPPPLKDLLAFREPVTENDVVQARQGAVDAMAAVAVEWAVHAPVSRAQHEGREGWCRADVTPGGMPEQAAALVSAAQAAVTVWAVRWMVWVGTDSPATFLPRRAA